METALDLSEVRNCYLNLAESALGVLQKVIDELDGRVVAIPMISFGKSLEAVSSVSDLIGAIGRKDSFAVLFGMVLSNRGLTDSAPTDVEKVVREMIFYKNGGDKRFIKESPVAIKVAGVSAAIAALVLVVSGTGDTSVRDTSVEISFSHAADEVVGIPSKKFADSAPKNIEQTPRFLVEIDVIPKAGQKIVDDFFVKGNAIFDGVKVVGVEKLGDVANDQGDAVAVRYKVILENDTFFVVSFAD